MKGWSFVAFLIYFCHQAAGIHIPHKRDLCGLIVDSSYETKCLKCFTDAGHLSDNPEGFRECVATKLPPLVAKCAVPHPDDETHRIEQHKPGVHHNHTNANLLPNCLKRRMRELSRYLRKENRFAYEAGNIVKTVVTSKLIKSGGPSMLGIISQRYILNMATVKNLVAFGAQSCLDEYHNDQPSDRVLSHEDFDEEESEEDDDDGDDDDDLEGALKSLKSDSRWRSEEENDDDGDADVNEDEEEEEENMQTHLRDRPSSNGNGLPYGGANPLGEEMILGSCIIDSLIKENLLLHLIQIIGQDEFFHPIPPWWVEPILRYYKDFREAVESDESG